MLDRERPLKIAIIVSLHSHYMDVAQVFCELLARNWADCPYDIYFSVDENFDLKLPGTVEKNSVDSSLPNNILRIVEKHQIDYAVCLLGDAFIADEIDGRAIEILLEEIISNEIHYCNLCSRKPPSSVVRYKHITAKEYYGVSFIAFIASNAFVKKEFSNNISDLDFAKKYLYKASETTSNQLFENMVYVSENYFHIMHGVNKGKWIRNTRNYLMKKSEMIHLSKRDSLNIKESLYLWITDYIVKKMPGCMRREIKRILKLAGFKFVTDY